MSRYAAEITGFLQQLVRTRSVNGVHPELEVASVIAGFAAGHGLAPQVLVFDHLEGSAQRPAVLVTLEPEPSAAERASCGDRARSALLIVAHMDTVPEAPVAAWKHDPFGAEIADGRMYGRGAADNKAGIAAAMWALLRLRDSVSADGSAVTRPVQLLCVPDEESGATGRLGVKAVHDSGRLNADGAIYAYAGQTGDVCVGHRGVARFKLHSQGTPMHCGSSQWQIAPRGGNAITGMSAVFLALEQLDSQLASKSLLPLDATSTSTTTSTSTNNSNENSRTGNSDELFGRLTTVITPALCTGGSGAGVVPGSCDAVVDVRLVPSVPVDLVEAEIRRAVADVCSRRPPLKVEVAAAERLPPTQIPTGSKVVRCLSEAIASEYGAPPRLKISGPANESYLLNGYGIPTCVWGPSGGNQHAPDEYVVLDSLERAARVYENVALLMMKS